MDEDDLPPRAHPSRGESLGGSLGQVTAGLVLVVILFAVVALIAYFAKGWL